MKGRWGPAAVALAVLGLHLACGGRYGFFRDELYFVMCGKHLALGYVDQPPVIAVMARIGWWLSGEGQSVLAFRGLAFASHAGTVLLAGRLARKLGGEGIAATLAATCAAVAPIQLAQGHLLTMNIFEQTLWVAVALLAVIAVDGNPKAWLGAGALLGLAMLTKYSALFLAVGLLVGLLSTPARSVLAMRWFWFGVLLAGGIALPSALWQLRHGLPFLELLRNGQAGKNAQLSPGQILSETVLEEGLGGILVASFGVLAFWKSEAVARFRFLGVAMVFLMVGMVALHAKPYYLAPAFTPLFAAGAVFLARGRRRTWMIPAVLLLAVPAWPIVIPVLPIEQMLAWQARLGQKPAQLERMKYSEVPQHFADQFGWRERVESVAAMARGTGAEAVFTTNYGRASALALFGARLGLPQVVSGHNSFAGWGVSGSPQRVIAVGGRAESYRAHFGSVTLLGSTPEIAFGMAYESSIDVFLLSAPREELSSFLAGERHFE